MPHRKSSRERTRQGNKAGNSNTARQVDVTRHVPLNQDMEDKDEQRCDTTQTVGLIALPKLGWMKVRNRHGRAGRIAIIRKGMDMLK